MSQYQAALELAQKGFHVFPLIPNSKKPTGAAKDFPNIATTDPAQIKAWWHDSLLGNEQDFNVGISTTKFGQGETLVVIDVDNKGEKKGDEDLLGLEMEGFDLPPTFEQFTPTGGRHLVFKANEPFKQGVKVFGSSGLDIRAKGGYIVGAGSKIDQVPYTFKDHEIAIIPDWLAAKLKRPKDEKASETASTVTPVDEVKATAKAVSYLIQDAPISIKGDGGDQTAYSVACRVKDFGVSEATCLEIMMDHWNTRSESQWTAAKLKVKIRNAYKYGTEDVGVVAPEKHFSPVETTEAEPVKKHYLQEINDKYALIFQEGGHVILHETVDEKGNFKKLFYPEASFKRKFSPFTIQQGKGKPQTYADVWLDWEDRRQYAGLCFAPGRNPGHNYYNTWKGFSCAPTTEQDATPEQKQGFRMWLDHAFENVCKGDPALYQWLMGYLAHTIQKPYQRPLTTLVFKGRKGTGKNALIERFGKLLGFSFSVAHNSRYLTSNFNGHLDSSLMLVLDEAFWSGDKSAEGQLKGLTTSPTIMIERKGKEPYTIDNLVRLVVIGNEDWLVPATSDERRYAVFNMGEAKMQNKPYFDTMRILLDEKGGCGLLLNYLLNFDLSEVDVNQAPKTQGLLDQKMASADLIEQWWIECLQEGRFIGSDFNDQWVESLPKEDVRAAFSKYLRRRNISNRAPTATSFGRRLNSMCKSIDDKNKKHENGRYIYQYGFPPIDQAREDYADYIGHEVQW